MHPPLVPPLLRSWTTSDQYELHGRLWPPRKGKTDTLVLYLHGIQSHGGWFARSASLLAQSGCPVLLPDRRGSGLNPAARGDTPNAQRWLDDLDDLWHWARSEYQVSHAVVVGVSWGGKLGTAWATARPEIVSRLLLIAPGVFPIVDIGLPGRLRVAWSLATRPSSTVPIPLNDPALFTDNPAGRAFIAADDLKLTHATARFLFESARLDHRVRKAPAGSLRATTTAFLAERDLIINNERTAAWLNRIAASPPTVVRFAGAAHTLEFEAQGDEFTRHLLLWAENSLPTAAQ